MDLGLPDYDGTEVTAMIRAGNSINKNTPIIALTAHQHEDEKANAFKCGLNDFLAKPFTTEKLEYLLQKFVITLQN